MVFIEFVLAITLYEHNAESSITYVLKASKRENIDILKRRKIHKEIFYLGKKIPTKAYPIYPLEYRRLKFRLIKQLIIGIL